MKIHVCIRSAQDSKPRSEILDLPTTGEIVIGRGGALALSDRHCSRRHARLSLDSNGDLILTDLGSRNGSFVNGRRVAQVTLAMGDRIEVGDVTIELGQMIAGAEPQTSEVQVVRGWPELYSCCPNDARKAFRDFVG